MRSHRSLPAALTLLAENAQEKTWVFIPILKGSSGHTVIPLRIPTCETPYQNQPFLTKKKKKAELLTLCRVIRRSLAFNSYLIWSRLSNCRCTCPTSLWGVTRVGLSPALLPKPFTCAQQGDGTPAGYSPNFCFPPGRCTEQAGFGGGAQEGFVCASSQIKCNTTLWPHQKTKHCSRQGASVVEALLWLRQKKGFPPPENETSKRCLWP